MSIAQNFPNIKPSLMLSFADTKQLDNRITFTRSTPAVYYDGKTTAMAEQNLITYSQELDNAAWSKANVTISANSTTSPDGTTNADKIVANSGSSIKLAYQVSSSTNSAAHSVSAFYKASEYSYAFLRIGGQSPSPYVIYDLSSQSIVSTANATSTSIEDYGSGWYRVSITYTTNSTTNAPNVAFLPSSGYTLDSVNQPVYNGDGVSGGYIYGAQLELGSYSTSLINTTSTAVTRLADSASKSGISSLINSTEGVLYVEMAALANDLTRRIITITDGTLNNIVKLEYKNVSNQIEAVVYNGSTQCLMLHTLSDETEFNKIAFKYKENDFSLFVNGTKVGTDVSGVVFTPNTLNNLSFHQGYSNYLYGNVQNLMVFPSALTDEQLADLTGEPHTTFNSLATFYGYQIL